MPDSKYQLGVEVEGDSDAMKRLQDLQKRVAELGKEAAKTRAGMGDVRVGSDELGGSIDEVDDSVQRLLQTLGGVAAAGFAAFAFGVEIQKTIDAAIAWESAFTGVVKTVNATGAELEKLDRDLRRLSTEMPITSIELARIAETAGQLGIQTSNIADFTKVMAQLGVTTNLSAEGAAVSLARLANITGLSQSEFDRLGSTIVGLGNNLATTEAEIVEMAFRIAGAGTTIGLTEPQILSMAGALSSLGVQAQAGGTSMSRLLIEIAGAVSEGGPLLQNFAGVAQMSAGDFSKAFKDDAAGAFLSFIQGLQGIDRSGGNVLAVLKKLGIEEIRVRDAILRLVGSGDLLNRSMFLGNKLWQENIALTREAILRFGTAESKLFLFETRMFEFRREMGEKLLPALLKVKEVLGGIAEEFTKEGLINRYTVGIGSLVIALNVSHILAFAGALGSIGREALAGISLMAENATNLRDLRTAMVLTEGSSAALALALQGVAAALLAIVAVQWAEIFLNLGKLYTQSQDISNIQKELGLSTREMVARLREAGVSYKELTPRVTELADAYRERMLKLLNETAQSGSVLVRMAQNYEKLLPRLQAASDKQKIFNEGLLLAVREMGQVVRKGGDLNAWAKENEIRWKNLERFAKDFNLTVNSTSKQFLAELNHVLGRTAKGLGDLGDQLTKREKELLAYAERTRDAVRNQQDLVDRLRALEKAGLKPREIMFALGKEFVSVSVQASTLKEKLLPLIEAWGRFLAFENFLGTQQEVLRKADEEIEAWAKTYFGFLNRFENESRGAAAAAARIPEEAKRAAEEAATTLNITEQQLAETGRRIAEEQERNAQRFGGVWTEQISLVVTDLSRGLADTLLAARGWAETMLSIVKNLASSLLRVFFEGFFGPVLSGFRTLLSGQGFGAGFAGGGLLSSLFGGGGGGAGGALSLTPLPGAGGIPGLFLSGSGAAGGAGGGLAGIGSSIGTLGGLLPLAVGIPVIGAAIAGLVALFSGLGRRGTGDVSKDILRDFGISVPTRQLEEFAAAMGFGKKELIDFQKAISSSPAFFEQILLPMAQAQGRVDELIARFSRLEAFGRTHDFGAAAAAAAAGDFSLLNEQWSRLFQNSDQFIRRIGGLGTLLSDQFDEADVAARKFLEALRLLEDQARLNQARALMMEFGLQSSADIQRILATVTGAGGTTGGISGAGQRPPHRFVDGFRDFRPEDFLPDQMTDQVRQLTQAERELLEQVALLLEFQGALSEQFNVLISSGASLGTIFLELGEHLATATKIADAFGIPLGELERLLGDLALRAQDWSDQTRLAAAAILDIRDSTRLTTLALANLEQTLTDLLAAGFSTEEISTVLEEALLQVAEAAQELGLELPELVSQFYEMVKAVEDTTDVTDDLSDALTALQQAFREGQLSFGEFLAEGDRLRAFLHGIGASADQFTDVLTAQRFAWFQAGSAVIQYADALRQIGLQVPQWLQDVLRWALAHAQLNQEQRDTIRNLLGIADAVQRVNTALPQFFPSGLQLPTLPGQGVAATRGLLGTPEAPLTVRFSDTEAKRLERILSPIEPFPLQDPLAPLEEFADRRLTFVDKVTGRVLEAGLFTEKEANRLVEVFGGSISRVAVVFGQAEKQLTGTITAIPESFRDVVSATPSLTPITGALLGLGVAAAQTGNRASAASNQISTLTLAVFDSMSAWINATNSLEDWVTEGRDLESLLRHLGREIISSGQIVQGQAGVWLQYGSRIVETANQFRQFGIQLPAAIAAAIEYAQRLGLVTINADGLIVRQQTMLEQFAQLAVNAAHTGVITDQLAQIMRQFGTTAERVSIQMNLLRARELSGLISEFQTFREQLQSLIPVQASFVEIFFQTGEITEEFRQRLEAAGADVQAFSRLGSLITIQNRLRAIGEEFSRTGQFGQEAVEIIRQYASPEIVTAFNRVLSSIQANAQGLFNISNLAQAARDTIIQAFASAGAGIRHSIGAAAQAVDANLGDVLFALNTELGLVTAAIIQGFDRIAQRIVQSLLTGVNAWDQVRNHIDRNPARPTLGNWVLPGGIRGRGGFFDPFDDARARWDQLRAYMSVPIVGKLSFQETTTTGSAKSTAATVTVPVQVSNSITIQSDGSANASELARLADQILIPKILDSISRGTEGAGDAIKKALREAGMSV